jgi:hypothetical protein
LGLGFGEEEEGEGEESIFCLRAIAACFECCVKKAPSVAANLPAKKLMFAPSPPLLSSLLFSSLLSPLCSPFTTFFLAESLPPFRAAQVKNLRKEESVELSLEPLGN